MLRYNDPCVFIATVGRVHTSLQRVKLINSLFDLLPVWTALKLHPPAPNPDTQIIMLPRRRWA